MTKLKPGGLIEGCPVPPYELRVVGLDGEWIETLGRFNTIGEVNEFRFRADYRYKLFCGRKEVKGWRPGN